MLQIKNKYFVIFLMSLAVLCNSVVTFADDRQLIPLHDNYANFLTKAIGHGTDFTNASQGILTIEMVVSDDNDRKSMCLYRFSSDFQRVKEMRYSDIATETSQSTVRIDLEPGETLSIWLPIQPSRGSHVEVYVLSDNPEVVRRHNFMQVEEAPALMSRVFMGANRDRWHRSDYYSLTQKSDDCGEFYILGSQNEAGDRTKGLRKLIKQYETTIDTLLRISERVPLTVEDTATSHIHVLSERIVARMYTAVYGERVYARVVEAYGANILERYPYLVLLTLRELLARKPESNLILREAITLATRATAMRDALDGLMGYRSGEYDSTIRRLAGEEIAGEPSESAHRVDVSRIEQQRRDVVHMQLSMPRVEQYGQPDSAVRRTVLTVTGETGEPIAIDLATKNGMGLNARDLENFIQTYRAEIIRRFLLHQSGR